jgi:hypothetical protein
MPITQLTPIGTPGSPYSFLAKTAAPVGEKGIGPFTELSVSAIPGIIHSFSAKTAAVVPGVKGAGEFTALSVLGLPGPIHSFLAKEVAVVPIPTVEVVSKGRVVEYKQLMKLRRDDNDLLEIIVAALTRGILN